VVFAEESPRIKRMNRRLLVILLVFCACLSRGQDEVSFVDGSRLRGQLVSFGNKDGILWNSPMASAPIGVAPSAVNLIRFQQDARRQVASGYSCRFSFFNGDTLYGDLISLGKRELKFRSWFAGELTAPREALKSLSFFHGAAAIYEGPNGLAEWHQGVPNTWWFRDAALVGGQNAFIAKKFTLPDRIKVKMRLTWQASLHLKVGVYTDSVERFNHAHRGYEFTLGGSYVNVTRGTGNGPSVIGSSTRLPLMNGSRPLEVELRIDRIASVLALLIDGRLIQKWNDAGSLDENHGGISFNSHTYSVSISDIRVSEWDGGFEDTGSTIVTNAIKPTIQLVNRDTFIGTVGEMGSGKLGFTAEDLDLSVALERVQQVHFPRPLFSVYGSKIPGVQAALTTDERLTLQMKDLVWPERGGTNRQASGHTVLFGPIDFAADWVTEMKFAEMSATGGLLPPTGGMDKRWIFD
jgi:hypothetical protein